MLSIIADVLKLVMRFFGKRDEPEAVRRREQNEIDKAVASGSERDVNVLLNDSLERLRNQNRRPEK